MKKNDKEMIQYLKKGCLDKKDWDEMSAYIASLGLQEAYDNIKRLFGDNWTPIKDRNEKVIPVEMIELLKQKHKLKLPASISRYMSEDILIKYCRDIEKLEVTVQKEAGSIWLIIKN